MTRIMSIIIIVLSGTTAALNTLPYGWAHLAATACAAAMGATGIGAGAYNLGATRPQSQVQQFWPESGK